ncbi:MAK10-like protein [Tanacetum coccineum]
MGRMWCLYDPTPSDWCKTDAHSTDFDLTLYDNESWNDLRDFAKQVKAISMPQDVPNASDRRLIELKNQIQCLMEAHLAPKSSVQVNKITSSCEICSGPYDTQNCMENLKQAFVDYASSRTDKAGGKWFTFKPEQNNLEEANHVFGLADITKSYPVGIVKNVEVHIGKLKLLEDFYVIDMEKDPTTPLHVGRGFLATASAVIDCDEDVPYWTTLGKREYYKPPPSTDGIGAPPPYYVKKKFMDYHLPGEWEIARDAELNPFKDVLVFRKIVEFL